MTYPIPRSSKTARIVCGVASVLISTSLMASVVFGMAAHAEPAIYGLAAQPLAHSQVRAAH